MTHSPQNATSFNGLGIAPALLNILDRNKFTTPTPIQHQAIPVALEGNDVIGIAQTGTGKTLAFGVPMIQRLAEVHGQGLILLPTRELAIQVSEELEKIGRTLGLKTAVLIGGASMEMQKRALFKRPHVIVATPGRLVDHMDQKTVRLDGITIVVLDEADRMLDIGFAPQINRILKTVTAKHQTMLFSATMPSEIAKIAATHMHMPIRIEVAPPGTSNENVEQEVFIVPKPSKLQLLDKILTETKGSVLVFTRTKFGAKKLAKAVRFMNQSAVEMHSDRSLAQRRAALDGFKTGKFRILVATDVAARGIDVKGIELVINFDLPDNPEDYVHRIGRTGRAGRSGKAISFAAPDQRSNIKRVERILRKTLPIIALPPLPPSQAHEPSMLQRSDDAREETRRERFHPYGRRGVRHDDAQHRGGQSDRRDAKPAAPGQQRSHGYFHTPSRPAKFRR